MGGRPETDGLMCLIPIYGIIVAFGIYSDVAKAFGKETGFAVMMLLLPFVAFPILGFGDAHYQRRRKKKNRRDDYEDDPRDD